VVCNALRGEVGEADPVVPQRHGEVVALNHLGLSLGLNVEHEDAIAVRSELVEESVKSVLV
jgi:hypothetical protein